METIRDRTPAQPLSQVIKCAPGLRREPWSEVQGEGLEKPGKNTMHRVMRGCAKQGYGARELGSTPPAAGSS